MIDPDTSTVYTDIPDIEPVMCSEKKVEGYTCFPEDNMIELKFNIDRLKRSMR